MEATFETPEKLRTYTSPEVATILGVSTRTLYTWAKQGKIHHFRVGRWNRYTEAEIQRFIESAAAQALEVH